MTRNQLILKRMHLMRVLDAELRNPVPCTQYMRDLKAEIAEIDLILEDAQ